MDENQYDYEFSPLAERDLDEIFDYITRELCSPQATEDLIDKIQSAVERVCEFPFSCPLLGNPTLRKKGYRLLIVESLNIFYVVEGKVVIRRILHGRRNYECLL